MEISLVYLLLIATVCAVVSAIIVCLCLSCCYCLSGRNKRRKIQGERLLYDVESPCLLKMERCQPLANNDDLVDKEKDKLNEKKSATLKGDSHFIFDERTVAEKAKNEENTLVWTSKGQVMITINRFIGWERMLL